ncbi:transposase [Vibrio cholerae MZO-3]|uniref:Truncated transposase n=1 Tax=Vibrio cholerae O37 TaxID=185332 RepID=Q8L342_VIBCL|nr:truncated transposase [Vibrio cholerae O37]KNA47332.1 transposase [Vibrio cholerae MZO-3]KNH49332.1 transposase [Vibrio cholerae V52]BCN17403.1 putative transposase [Vibrio cholerae]OFJ40782.1 IS5 family transposase [Vibrio cholerae V52]
MPKPRYKTTNWKQYNKALINRGSLTFWIDEEAIRQWKLSKQNKRGRPRQFSDLAITTALMVKRVFSMPLRALQGFIDSVRISVIAIARFGLFRSLDPAVFLSSYFYSK